MKEKVKVQFIKVDENAKLPKYAHDGDSGLDLHTAEHVELQPGVRKLVTTGLKIKIPYGFEGQVRPRSGNALKLGITVLNTPGTIDSTYDGELKVILFNTSKEVVTFNKNDRIAQLVIMPVVYVDTVEVTEFNESSQRGSLGFGSTGV